MRRARVVGAMAIAAGLVAVPAALAAPGHHGHVQRPAKVHYDVTGISTTASPTTTLGLSGVKYHPTSVGSLTPLSVTLSQTATKFVNRHGKTIAEKSIKTGDRIEVVWVEPGGSTPSVLLTATKVIDLSIGHRH